MSSRRMELCTGEGTGHSSRSPGWASQSGVFDECVYTTIDDVAWARENQQSWP